ncbi:MAG: DUF3971 domain-containing protein [Paracoccaceae bacterium]
MLALILGLLASSGRTMQVPGWVRDELSSRVTTALDGAMAFDFGDISLVIGDGWRPRVRFRNLVLTRPDGQEALRLADAEVSFSASALLQGEVRPKHVLVTGAFATLRMESDGSVALTMGDAAQPTERAQSIPQLMGNWDEALEHPILSQMTDFEIQAMTLNYENARVGRAWTVDGGQVILNRDGDDLDLSATFSLLSGRDYASTVELNYASQIGDLQASFGFSVLDIAAEDIAAQSVALSWLEVLRAPISGRFRGGIEPDGSLGLLHATLRIGEGVLQPTEATRPIPFDHAATYLTYLPSEQTLTVEQISLKSAWASGIAEGQAYLNGVDTGRLDNLVAQVQLSDVLVNPSGLYPEPLAIAQASADFRLELNPFRLSLGQMYLTDGPSNFQTSGELTAAPEGWVVSLDSHVDQMTPARLLEIWPEGVVFKPRRWVEENLFDGTIRDVNFALRTQVDQPPDMYLDFDIIDATMRVAKFLPPATGVHGTASLLRNRFAATVLDGVVESEGYGAVEAAGSTFVIPDVRIKPNTPATVFLEGQGPAAAVLSLLNRPPLSIMKNTTLPVDLADGWVQAKGQLDLPLKKGLQIEETDFRVAGVIEKVESTILVPGHRITADRLTVEVRPDKVELGGPLQISGIPAEATWTQPIGQGEPQPGQLNGLVELSEDAVNAFKIGLPPGSVSGRGPADFRIDLPPGKAPVLSLKSELKGVGLAMPAMGWRKSQDSTGSLELTARLGKQPEVEELTLDAAGMTATGRITTRSDGGLDRASFSSVRIGGWFSAPVVIVGRGKSVPVALRVGGGQLDLQRAQFGGGNGESGPMEVALDRLKITENIVLNNFQGRFAGGRGLRGTFTGQLRGRTPVTGEVSPHETGRSAFRVTAANAGGVLRDAGLLTQGRGGDFSMTLIPGQGTGTYDGSARIRNLRVTDAPAIAAVLDAISIVGLIDEMAGPGILFGEVVTRFSLAPDKVTVYQGSAEGPSIGMSMDGTYDIKADRLRMQGVISPLYLINGIGSLLTRRGEGLIGFNYTLQGPASKPKVQVNPLSALAPGFVREALRPPPPKDPNAPEPGSQRSHRGAPDPLDGSTGGR